MDQIELIQAVKLALEKLFGNCDVSPEQMKADLEGIKDDIDSMIESLAGDEQG